MTSLSSSLPKTEEGNGLGALRKRLLDEPDAVHLVIALVDCKTTTTDHDNGTHTPTARIRSIEAVLDPDVAEADAILRRALEERTGISTLPFTVGHSDDDEDDE